MGTDGGWSARSLELALYDQGRSFDFYQAVKLLELLHPETAPIGEGMRLDQEAVRFRSNASYAFAETEIEIVTPGADDDPATMLINFMGLIGPQAPLPQPFMRMMLDRAEAGDGSMRDFLDIFNHRLVSLLYRVRKTHRVGFIPDPPGEGRFAGYIYGLIGLGTENLRNRLGIPDAVLLRYAGLLAGYPRSAAGLECILADYFHADIQVRQFRGQWLRLDADQWTAIGASGRNQVLGESFLLGKCIRDMQGKLEVQLGPLGLREFVEFLPIGSAFRALCELTKFYLQNALAFDLRLRLKGKEVPGFRIGGDRASRLGWTSWLKTRDRRDEGVVELRSHLMFTNL